MDAVSVSDADVHEQGDIVPEFVEGAIWTNGSLPSMESLRGKVILIDAWHPTCAGCFDSIPAVHALQSAYGKLGLVTMGAVGPYDLEEREEEDQMIGDAVRDYHISYPCLLDPGAQWSQKAGFKRIPAFMVIGKDGRIRLIHHGKLIEGQPAHAKVDAAIKSALAE